MTTPYRYIRSYYGETVIVGEWVRHTVTGRYGKVIRPVGDPHYVRVRFDGDNHAMNAHPKELEYSCQPHPSVATSPVLPKDLENGG